jgi:hypothetical protein
MKVVKNPQNGIRGKVGTLLITVGPIENMYRTVDYVAHQTARRKWVRTLGMAQEPKSYPS